MGNAVAVSTLIALTLACGPEAAADGPLGELAYEHAVSQLYKLDRRVEIIPLDPMLSSHECGFLTDRAHDDLGATIEALDPLVDYDAVSGCDQSDPSIGLVHLEGFEHSPFVCGLECCHPDLTRIAMVYIVAENNFSGIEPIVDGTSYVAVEPGRPCP
jgi:hypothetical protein